MGLGPNWISNSLGIGVDTQPGKKRISLTSIKGLFIYYFYFILLFL